MEFMYRTQKEQDAMKAKVLHWILIGSIGVIALIIILGSFYIVDAGQRAVLITLGNPSMSEIAEGLHFKFPLIQSVVIMDVKTQKDELDSSAASKDLQTVTAKIAINYHLTPSEVPRLYKEIGTDYVNRVLNPAIQEIVKASTAQFTAEELITKREEVIEKITSMLQERMASRGIIVERVLVTNFDFSATFNAAIEAKVTAEQNALAAKNKLEQVKYEADQAIAAAEGKAKAIQVEGDALRNNPQVATLRAIEKWDGIAPTTLINGQNTIFGFFQNQQTTGQGTAL